MIDIERIEKYVSIGFDKEEARKMVIEEYEKELQIQEAKKAETKPETNPEYVTKKDMDETISRIEESISKMSLNGLTSEAREESALDTMTKVFGGGK